MSIEGTAQTEYASLSGKIKTFVVDKTLTISGACADAKATGEAIEFAVYNLKEDAAAYAMEMTMEEICKLEKSLDGLVDKAIAELPVLTTAEIRAICT